MPEPLTLQRRTGVRRAHWIPTFLAVLLVATATVGIVYPLWWDHRSGTIGHELLQRGLTGLPSGSGAVAAGRCDGSPTSSHTEASTALPGVLEIPSIGLKAPVVNGMTTSVLEVAVGHDPTTVWPGEPGESILLAHDVSYFSGLDRVRPGALVIWKLGCAETEFRVSADTVAKPGAAVAVPPSGAGLALVTCWPTNALFWTPNRFVVETTIYTTRTLGTPVASRLPPLVHLVVPAPPALAAEGLALGQSGVVVGTMTFTGSPSASFTQGPQPLAIESAALEDYAAAAKTADAGEQSWWSALALPGVALPAPWSIVYYTNVTLSVTGANVEQVVLSSPAATVTLVVHDGELLVAAVGPGASQAITQP